MGKILQNKMKSSIDLICVHPQHLDYPLFRKFIHENRNKFAKVIIIFSNMNTSGDYRQFVQDAMAKDDVIFRDSPQVDANYDWRNIATRFGLSFSDSEWIWFMEQDFFPQENFFREINDLMKRCDVFGKYQEGRLHPCCIFIKRELLDKTSKDFSANPPDYDHFGKLQRDLERKDLIIGVIFDQYGHHMNGLSQNLHMLQTGIEPNYNPPEFKEYCKKCLEIEPLHPDFKELFEWYLNEE